MKAPRRFAWLLVILGFGLLLGIVFRDWVLANFVIPMAVVLLLVWRLVLSVHQAVYWGLVLLAATAVACNRLYQVLGKVEEVSPQSSATILKSVDYWQATLVATGVDSWAALALKRELGRMLVAIYAIQQPDAKLYDLHEALRRGSIPVPATIHAFLFPDQAVKAERPWRRRLRGLVAAPRALLRRWTGRDKVEYYQSVEETLEYMEILMEMRHGDTSFDSAHR